MRPPAGHKGFPVDKDLPHCRTKTRGLLGHAHKYNGSCERPNILCHHVHKNNWQTERSTQKVKPLQALRLHARMWLAKLTSSTPSGTGAPTRPNNVGIISGMPKGAIYARYSPRIEQDQSFTIENQIAMCHELAAKDGVVIDEHHIYQDHHISGPQITDLNLSRC